MPTLGNALDFAQLEAKSMRIHQLGTAPTVPAPVKGQIYFNTGDNTMYWYNGSTWVAASAGAGGPPSGTAAGDLAGTYPNPDIKANVIVDADINTAAGIQKTKLAPLGIVDADITGPIGKAKLASLAIVDADIAAGAAIANTKLATNPLARANHTGSQLAATVSDFDTQVRTSRLDQLVAPNGAVGMNSQKLTGLGTPTGATDAATMAYVDSVAQGLDAKQSVRCATTGPVTIATGLNPGDIIDNVTLVNGDRVLVKDHVSALNNGIYIAGGAPGRSADADVWTDLPGAFVFVEEGTVNADTGWVCTADSSGTLGVTSVPWVQFSSAGSQIAGSGLTKSGNTIDVGGTANRISVAADAVDIAATYAGQASINTLGTVTAGVWNGTDVAVADGGTGASAAPAARTNLGAAGYYSSATHGAGTTISIPQATHGLRASRGLLVQVQVEATGEVVLADILVGATGDVTVTFGVSQSANTIRVTVIG